MKEKPQRNQRRTPKQTRAVEKYNRVLVACTQLLLTRGYQQITMLELSLESDVAVPTIYQYFEDKEQIFLAWIDRLLDQVLCAVAQAESSLPPDQLPIHIDRLIEIALLNIARYQVSLQQLLMEIPNALSGKVIQSMEDKTMQAITALYPQRFAGTAEETSLLHFRLLTLTRMIIGYFIQRILNTESKLDSQVEAAEIARIVRAYLQEQSII